ncbi:DUF6221 family protein [Streptomyces sp. A13(2022)]|uniref:DUF6221 family protein n=1 Tax=Streptomyces sp. A13(2022) TaxID=2964768 RepID=UPI0021D9222E|nr:DUF6221 family protein [Streptomyces sp. A13(2022)]MCU8589332.1 DUF6221 family protein [Streptomyces sp. A13(2022)]
MDELVVWLRAQLDEEAEAAQRAFSGQADPENGWGAYRPEGQRHTTITPHVGIVHETVQADHVVTWNPARVLREIEAKRHILAQCAYWNERADREAADPPKYPQPGLDLGLLLDAMNPVLRLLAQPYADRPGYREAWRP